MEMEDFLSMLRKPTEIKDMPTDELKMMVDNPNKCTPARWWEAYLELQNR